MEAWPWILGAYGALAATFPWSLGGVDEEELGPGTSVVLGVVLALPCTMAARWLAPTPYRPLALGCAALVGLWGIHLLVALARTLARALLLRR